ncbi:MAG: phycobiliprotein lyase [Cyanobacteriota bacterium]|nr:phycobiliprotein lyase [Cyanobacteriota bacterium]
MTQSGPEASGPPFPPDSIEAFLRFCAGEWMSLRSRFELEGGAAAGESAEAEAEGDEWHSSERGELVVAYLEPVGSDGPGGLSVGPKGELQRQLLFTAEGRFTAGDQQGQWQLLPDSSLELVLSDGEREVRERIWFTKPNLRLRSTLERFGDGSPSRASFCSEIRRVSRPASPAQTSA